MFALYSSHPMREEAEQEGNLVIERFLQDARKWQKNYTQAGASDSGASEAFAQEVARRLGIVRLSTDV